MIYNSYNLFKTIYYCGIISDFGLELLNVNEYMLDSLVDSDFLIKICQDKTSAYQLTEKAKDLINNIYGLNKIYIYKSISYSLELEKLYLSLDLNNFSWKTRDESLNFLLKQFILKGKINDIDTFLEIIHSIDAVIYSYNLNTVYVIEILSEKNSNVDVNKKELFFNSLEIEYIYIYT